MLFMSLIVARSSRVSAPNESRSSRFGEDGQTFPLVCLYVAVLLGIAGVVIDLGNAYVQRRLTQNVADAAALAGAMAIPSGSYTTAAQQNAAENDKAGDHVSVSFNGSDTLTVTVTRTSPTFLMGVFGKNSITVSSTAKATVEAVGQIQGHVSPYSVTRQAYANGAGTTLFQENQPGAYGTIDLPAAGNTSGGSCTGTTNKGTPSNISQELGDQLPAGQIVLGGCVSVKSGASQPSANVVNQMPNTNNDMAEDLQSLGNGEYQVIPQLWDDSTGLPPRLMYVPIVDSLPGGNGNATITGFAWFYMTSATSGGSGLTINGQFVTLRLPPTSQTTAYIPGALGQVITAELTG
jgi:Flp pilus assembly protein TadG